MIKPLLYNRYWCNVSEPSDIDATVDGVRWSYTEVLYYGSPSRLSQACHVYVPATPLVARLMGVSYPQ